MKSLGGIVFVTGLILAIIISIFAVTTTPLWAVITLAIMGLVVGLLNIDDEEIQLFLVASIAFLISFTALSNVFTIITWGWSAIPTFFGLMNVFVAPATAVVAVKALFLLAKN